MDEILESSKKYALNIVDKWQEIGEAATEFRVQLASGRVVDPDIQNKYVSLLTVMWEELRPKIYGNQEFKDFETIYMSFEVFVNNPHQLNEDGKEEVIFKMHRTIREALEKIKITRFI